MTPVGFLKQKKSFPLRSTLSTYDMAHIIFTMFEDRIAAR